MDEEVDFLINTFRPNKHEIIHGYNFYVSEYKSHKIVICLTGRGLINACISTQLAIEKFRPELVINQGCAGSHKKELSIGNIIIGEKVVYINNFKTTTKKVNEGSNSLEWIPHKTRSYRVDSTLKYIEIAKQIECNNKVKVGILGSADIFSKEYDRIVFLNNIFAEDCEDMESIATFKVCETFNVDRVAFRIISNNELTGEELDKSTCLKMQHFVKKFIDKL
ncbi:MAG: 5'-methylthioadenosine/S-adenosylhomocysteine nucleosidase [Clostridia bacterium]|nr:5'-methylthioadenosine/S-adenosylhomocysteine nucleosidase [Clostridia bacterium]